MNTNKVVGTKLCIIAIVSALCALVLTPGVVCAADIFVGPGETYTTIQSAVAIANPFDTIIVRDGIYTENINVTIDNVTIRSENGSANCVVNASASNDHVFEVTADYVNISGFTVQNATGTGKAGIYLKNVDHCTISNNTASNNYYGIFLQSSSYNNLTGNTAHSNNWRGFYLSSSSNNYLTGNTANSNTESGIILEEYSNNNYLTGNTASNNWCGIYLSSSGTNYLTGNTANSNGYYGIYLESSSINNKLTDNNALNNWRGIYLYSSSNNTLTGNTASNNTRGVYLYSSSNNTLTGNTANSNNDYGIYLQYSNNNLIYNNYFNNTNNAWDNGNNIWNITQTSGTNIIGGPNLGGNYWSDYNGDDTNGDGFGDTLLPYNSLGDIQYGGDWLPLVNPTLRIRIGYQPSTHQLAHMTAMENGWWEEDLKMFGVENVADREFPSGSPEMQAMMNGEIDIAYVGVTPLIAAIGNGLDAKIVAGVQINGSHLVLRPEINYLSPEDLIGLKIATFPPCSVLDIVLKKWFLDNGLDCESDLELIVMEPGEAIEAIENGSVDGVFLPHPAPAMIELNGSGEMVIASGEMWPNHACCYLVVSGKLIREHPDMVTQIIKTHIKATEYVIDHQDEAAEIYVNKTGAGFTAVNYSLNTWDGAWISDPRIELNGTLEYAKIMYNLSCVNRSVTEDDLFDFRFYDEVTVFDTGTGTYPSISGTHNGTIKPSRDLSVSKLYTYPCAGTGGHAEYIKIWNTTGWNVTATWNGYTGDWGNLTFAEPFILYAGTTYNYTIITGSYPQIIHKQEFNATGGTITCTKFMDANGKEHYDWIPAIRLEAEEIRIGIVAPLTGNASTAGNDMWQSAILAADEINAKGGVNVNGVNMKITLVKGDTQTSIEGCVKAVTKLITEDKVDLLVGGYSTGVTLAGQVVAAEHKVPFIITGAAYPAVTRRTDINTSYFFHHCPTTDDFANSTLLFVDEIVKPQIYERFNFSAERPLRLAVLYQDSSYGKAVYDGINKTIEHYNLSMEVVAAEKFTQGETDYTSVLSTIKAAEPDIVYPAAFVNEQPLIVAQGRRDVGLNTTYLSVECNDDPEYYTGVESWGEYSIQEGRFSPYAIPPSPIYSAVVEFKADYENRWGTSPGMMGASTYEGVYIAAEAIENAGTIDKEEIRDALTEIEMPQLIELMKDDVITFSPDYRESKFELYMQQLIWNGSVSETRPKIVWPDNIKETDFVLPDWYEPGSP